MPFFSAKVAPPHKSDNPAIFPDKVYVNSVISATTTFFYYKIYYRKVRRLKTKETAPR